MDTICSISYWLLLIVILFIFLQLFFIIYGLTGNVMMNEICYVIYFFSIGIMEKSNKKNRAGVKES